MVTNVILEIKDQLQIYALKIKIKYFFENLGEQGLDSTFVNEVVYKLFHSVIDQIISRQITAHYTSLCYFPLCTFQFRNTQ